MFNSQSFKVEGTYSNEDEMDKQTNNGNSDTIIDLNGMTDISKTKNPLYNNEYMVITKEGLYFM